MQNFLLSVAILLAIGSDANAEIPVIKATCPGNIEVRSDEGGPVYINGKESAVTEVRKNYYEAVGEGAQFTVSISVRADGSASEFYTTQHGGDSVCKISGSE